MVAVHSILSLFLREERFVMSGNVGYENVKECVKWAGTAIAGGIRMFKKAPDIVAEVKDTQLDEVFDLCLTEVKNAALEILEAIKA
jgi:hypothetical protein